jgi:hypothetical protein
MAGITAGGLVAADVLPTESREANSSRVSVLDSEAMPPTMDPSQNHGCSILLSALFSILRPQAIISDRRMPPQWRDGKVRALRHALTSQTYLPTAIPLNLEPSFLNKWQAAQFPPQDSLLLCCAGFGRKPAPISARHCVVIGD